MNGQDDRRPSNGIPRCPRSWFLVCASRDLRPGRVRTWSPAGLDVVLFRGRDDRRARALAAPCIHMGTHLGFGDVVGDELRCPLHHWRFDGDGRCRQAQSEDAVRQPAFPVVERFGAVFVFLGPEPSFEVPGFSRAAADEVRMIAGSPVRLRCDWHAVASNGFDIQHLQTVHGRALDEPPELVRLDAHRVRLTYTSRVTGTAFADRFMKALSGDRIRVCVTCVGGSLVTVESDLGRARSVMMMSVHPLADGTEVRPLFGIFRGAVPALDALRLAAARWLFSAFMRKDVAFMDDMRFHRGRCGPVDPVLHGFLDFLEELPSAHVEGREARHKEVP